MTYCRVIDPADGHTVDEALAVFMKSPHTYTREDVVEINCHGGHLALQRILKLCLDSGARLANPGEFTLRAFLNGRIDLAQAESVLDVIQAKTEAALRLGVQGLEGELSRSINALRYNLVQVLAYLSATIDFPEDDIPEQDILGPLADARLQLKALVDSADAGIIYRQGVRTAIVGRPNVGKSSLLNRLLRQERAIVTAIPGTTRDTLEETVNLGGIPFVLIDTAGITESKNLIEALGIERSRKAIAQADLVLLVIDTSQPLAAGDLGLMEAAANKKGLVAANKCDLPVQVDIDSLPRPVVPTSAATGKGLPELEREMIKLVLGGRVTTTDTVLVTNPRHKAILERAEDHLVRAQEAVTTGLPEDCAIIDLNAAIDAIGEITGQSVSEDLLNTIFDQFCIGK